MTTIHDTHVAGGAGHGPHDGHAHGHHDHGGGDHHDHGSYLTPLGGFWSEVWRWATTIDHKKIGIMYLVAVLFMFFLGGMAAMAVRLELVQPMRTTQVSVTQP